MLIEVCGPDGVGKSTVIDALRGRIRKGGHSTAYERTLRSESRNLLEIARLSSPASFSVREIELVVVLDAVEQASGELGKYRGSPVMHVFVQNYRHALTARLQRKGMEQDQGLRWLVRSIPPPDLSVRLDADWHQCLDRIQRRAKGDELLLAADAVTEIRQRIESFALAAAEIDYPQVVVCANDAPDQVAESVWQHVLPTISGFPVS